MFLLSSSYLNKLPKRTMDSNTCFEFMGNMGIKIYLVYLCATLAELRVLERVGFLFLLLGLAACSVSSAPKVEDLITVAPPTIEGRSVRSYTTASFLFQVNGECDNAAILHEY